MTGAEDTAAPRPEAPKAERIAKVLARAGICSRRDAEKMILEGRVSVDGKKLDSPAVNVTPNQSIVVDGKPLPAAEAPRLWCYHKKKGLMTSHKDPEGRPTVFEKLPPELPRVISVGRLDFNSEGLLLLTNDGELARRLELPETGWVRRYRVRVYGVAEPEKLAALAKGVTIDGVRYGPITVLIDHQERSNAWLTVALREGKNREVRRVLEHIGLPVNRLIRVAYGPFQLGNLEPGQVREVPGKVLADQLGRKPGDRTGEAKAKPHGAAASRDGKREAKPGDERKERPATGRQGKLTLKTAGKAPARSDAKAEGRPAGKPEGRPPARTPTRAQAKPTARTSAKPPAKPTGRARTAPSGKPPRGRS